ncbi:MAG TPA: chloride channel protein [Thermoanaerobaculia bacterium]|nr:chloride channel protein [Thermoanaerobaculia bacterium]
MRRTRVALRRLRVWRRRAEFALARRFGLVSPEDRRFYLLVPIVGVLAGVLGISVDFLIEGSQRVLWGRGELLDAALAAPVWLKVGAPLAGGLLVGAVVWLGRQPLSGTGMSVLIESVVLRQGAVPPRPMVLNALASIFTVGSGGSLGKEGPMIRLGAAFSSWAGQRLGLPPHRLKILVGAGAGAGLAAAYNVPVGGALFAMEVILGNFALEIFGPIVVASVISTVIARSVLGDVPVYAATEYQLVSGWELLAYLGLGVVGAVASVGFVSGVRWGRTLFARQRWLPAPLQPAVGFALLGGLAIYVPHVLGSGFETITLALHDQLALGILLLLPLAKIVATALTAGSGGAGGMFTPSLFVGAMVGGAYGYGIHALWPTTTATYGAYAVVGMAAIAAGTSHAPISAILILFEFTGNYDLILPLMIAAITASVLSRSLYPYSVYEESLRRRGVDLQYRMEEAVLAGMEVESLMRQDAEVLRPDAPYVEVVERFLGSRRQRLFVVDDEKRLLGAVSLHDIKHVLQEPAALTAVLAHDLMVPVERTLHPATRLHRVTEEFSQSDFERLPVVDPETGRLLGVLAKRDLLSIYSQEVLGRPATLATFVTGGAGRDYVELPPDFALRLVPVPAQLAGRTLAAARLPQTVGVRVVELKRPRGRETERVIPDGETVLRPGDALIAIGPREALERLARGEVARDEASAMREID